jgi:hypothetical protein
MHLQVSAIMRLGRAWYGMVWHNPTTHIHAAGDLLLQAPLRPHQSDNQVTQRAFSLHSVYALLSRTRLLIVCVCVYAVLESAHVMYGNTVVHIFCSCHLASAGGLVF